MPSLYAAGLLMCDQSKKEILFFLVHPGGPFFKAKNEGFWSIPKGLPNANEALLDTARREFEEETGIVPRPPFHSIGSIKQKSGKVVHAWTFEGGWDPATGIKCNTFPLEWPPRSGNLQHFPEVDRAEWMDYDKALRFINKEQSPFLERAREIIANQK
jgi:predicted NUDIX family NTP pyrophosphohydrolase